MTISEFSDGFDTLIAAYTQQRVYGLTDTPLELAFDEYEKSQFLTEAQSVLVRELYDSPQGTGYFEADEKIREALESLVKQVILTQGESSGNLLTDQYLHTRYKIQDEAFWYIIYEQVSLASNDACLKGKTLSVLPVRHDDYTRIKENPFRGPNNRKVLRLNNGGGQLEIESKYPIASYTVRYLSRPEPIVLVPLEGRLAIQGVTTPQTCKLHDSLHKVILNKAIELAIKSKSTATPTQQSTKK